jgi:major membrane immunogen (membrane-anchored lipoprotein)
MKRAMTIFGAILVASSLMTSCGSDSTGTKEVGKTVDTLKNINDTLKSDDKNNTAEDSIIQIPSNKVTCTEKETKNEDGGEPILTKTCLYKTFKTISKGFPDYKGRYSYEYSILKKQENGSFLPIKNASLFNKNKNELLSIINKKIEKDYNSYSNNPETKECFEGISFTPFNFNELGIKFESNTIEFNVTFGLSGACMSVDGTTISMKLDEIQKYLNE